jgi:small subunit ribosomal protein S18
MKSEGEITLSEEERPQQRERSQERRPRGGRRYHRRPRVCQYCADKINSLNYKQLDVVKRMVNDAGKIRSRRETGNCAKHQRMVARAVKRARHMALVPYTSDRLR